MKKLFKKFIKCISTILSLNKRKEAIVKILEEKKLLTPELKTKIDEVDTKACLRKYLWAI